MKQLTGGFVFIVAFALTGVGMHSALYGKPGIFVWSLASDAETGKRQFIRTTVDSFDGVGVLDTKPENPGGASAAAAQEAEEQLESAPAPEPVAKAQNADEAKPEKKDEVALFDGKALGDWKKTQFGGEGDVFVNEDGNIEFGFGAIMTGVHWGGDVPATSNYELTLDAMKLDGHDFFLALTFPVKESHATFVIGGWGGGVVGISSVDDLDASENETMNIEGFETDRWYKVKIKVTDDRLEAWIDDSQMVDLDLEDRKISLRPGDIELCVPIGLASFQTRAQYRNISWKNLPDSE